MKISKEKLDQIREILGQDFIVVIAVPENVKARGTPGAGVAEVEMVASMGKDAVEYVLLAAAIQIWEGGMRHEEHRGRRK